MSFQSDCSPDLSQISKSPSTEGLPQKLILLVLLMSVTLNAAGQLLFKAARLSRPEATLIALFLEAEIWAGLLLYGLSSISWLWVLSRIQLSFAYPVLALSFPIVVALSSILFGEAVVTIQWAGVGLIIVGVSLLSWT